MILLQGHFLSLVPLVFLNLTRRWFMMSGTCQLSHAGADYSSPVGRLLLLHTGQNMLLSLIRVYFSIIFFLLLWLFV